MRRILSISIALLSAGVLFSSCLKDNDNDNGQDIPAAGLMAFNLAPDQEAVTVSLSGSMLTQQPLSYTNFTGLYQRIYTGERVVESFDYVNSKKLAPAVPYNFEQDKSYSVFVIGADSAYRNVISFDDVDSSEIASGKAYVRYVNAIIDSVNMPAVTIAAAGNNVVNDNAAYAGVSEFKAINAGDITVAAKSSNVDISRTITAQPGKAYTILLIGVPGDTGAASKPQIKYIENGTVSSEQEGS